MIKNIWGCKNIDYFGLYRNYVFDDYGENNVLWQDAKNNLIASNIVPEFVDDVSLTITLEGKGLLKNKWFFVEFDQDSLYTNKRLFYWVDGYTINNVNGTNVTFNLSLEIMSMLNDYTLSVKRANNTYRTYKTYPEGNMYYDIIDLPSLQAKEGFDMPKTVEKNVTIEQLNVNPFGERKLQIYDTFLLYKSWPDSNTKTNYLNLSTMQLENVTLNKTDMLVNFVQYNTPAKRFDYASDSIFTIKYLPHFFRISTSLCGYDLASVGGDLNKVNGYYKDWFEYDNKTYTFVKNDVNYLSPILKTKNPFYFEVRDDKNVVKLIRINNVGNYVVGLVISDEIGTIYFLTRDQTIIKMGISDFVYHLKLIESNNYTSQNFVLNLMNFKSINNYDNLDPPIVKSIIYANRSTLNQSSFYCQTQKNVGLVLNSFVGRLTQNVDENWLDPKTIFSDEINTYFLIGNVDCTSFLVKNIDRKGQANFLINYNINLGVEDVIEYYFLSENTLSTTTQKISNSCTLKTAEWQNYMYNNSNSWQIGLSYAENMRKLNIENSNTNRIFNSILGSINIGKGVGTMLSKDAVGGVGQAISGAQKVYNSETNFDIKMLTADYSVNSLIAQYFDKNNVVDVNVSTTDPILFYEKNNRICRHFTVENIDYLNKHFLLFGWKKLVPQIIKKSKLFEWHTNNVQNFLYFEGTPITTNSSYTLKQWDSLTQKFKEGLFVIKSNVSNSQLSDICSNFDNKNNFLRKNKEFDIITDN